MNPCVLSIVVEEINEFYLFIYLYMYITLVLLLIFFFLHIFHFPGQAGCPPLAPSVTIISVGMFHFQNISDCR